MKNLFLKKVFLITVLFLIYLFNINAKEFNFYYSEDDKYQLVIRGDIKVYVNGNYKGLQTKEMKGILDVSTLSNNKVKIGGNVYHYNKAIRDNQRIGFEVDKYEKCNFFLDNKGYITSSDNPVFPPVQNVPFFPEININPGDVYQGYGKVGIVLYDTDKIDTIEIKITIRYNGEKILNGVKYDYFDISYDYGRILESSDLNKARGRHNLEFYFDSQTGKPVFMRDKFLEEFQKDNGDIIKRDGFILYFYKLIIPMDKKEVVEDLKKDTDDDFIKDLDFKKKEEGVSITINNLKFKPDSTELLGSEKPKLDKLYEMLSKIEDRSFLIIGHTALAGTEESRMKLSLERARYIAEYLVKRGISPERIFYTGKGAKEPVAPNDTEENMKKNRRVEIIILED